VAKFFIPSQNCKSYPSNGIKEDVLFDLDRLLPPEAIVCVGLDAYDHKRNNERDIDLVVITKTAVHVIESKDKDEEPVIYKTNEGLFIKHENGSKTYIMNNDESARDQARECVHTVEWGFWRASRKLNTCLGYILVPHAFEGSNLYELTGLVRGCKSVEELVQLISRRDSNAIKKQRANQFSIQEMEETVKIQFGVHQTDTIGGYKIGNPPKPVDKHNKNVISLHKSDSKIFQITDTITDNGKIANLSHSGFQHFQKRKYYFGVAGLLTIALFFLITAISSQRGCFNGNSPLNVRSSPESQAVKVGQLDKGSCFYVNGISQDGKWVRIGSLSNYRKWVYATYVDGINPGELKKIK